MNKSFGRYITASSRLAQGIINKKLENTDIKSGQHHFMYVICDNEGINQKELSERLKIGKATTTKAVKSLMESGYVKREKYEDDKRFYKLYLTDKGREIAPLVRETFREVSEIYSSGFTEEESEEAIKILEKIFNNVYSASKKEHCE